jgi:hypothetical protein
MIGRPQSYLGLAVSDRGIACAEVSSGPIPRNSQRSVRRTAIFTFTEVNTLENSAGTGQALASFLRENRFGATRAVVGVPARWLIAAEKDVPPVGAEQAKAMLRIQAERQSGAETGEMVFDYAGETSSSAASRVLMVGIGKTQLERVEQLIDAAGLSIAAITSTGLAMAGSLNPADGDGKTSDAAMLLLQPNGGEMVVRQNGNVKILRHVPFAMNGHGIQALAPLGAELRRTIALGAAGSTNREVTLMNGVGLGREQVSELSDRAGITLRAADEMKLLGLSRDSALKGALASGADAAEGYIFPAVSLALAGNKPSALPLDFAHSKLAPPPVTRFSRRMVYAVAVGALIVIGLAALYWDVSVQQSKLDTINANIDKMKPTLATAQHVVDRVSYAEGFLNARPAMLDCVKQLSLTLPESDRIWVETLSMLDNGKCTLSGKATDEPTVLALVEQMKRNSKFSGVDLKDVHEADQRTHEWTYSLNFNFNLAE